MHSSYQVQETHYGDMSLSVHDRINDLHRRARGLAPRVEDETADAGATNMTVREHRQLGPRQRTAWDMVAEALSWNAISDSPALLAEAERYERGEVSYRVEYVGGMDPEASPWALVTMTTEAPAIDSHFDSDHDGSWTPDGQRLTERSPQIDPQDLADVLAKLDIFQQGKSYQETAAAILAALPAEPQPEADILSNSTELAARFPDMGRETAQFLTDEADDAYGMDDPGKLGEFIRRETDPITLATTAESLYRVSRRDDGRYQVTQVMHEQRSQA